LNLGRAESKDTLRCYIFPLREILNSDVRASRKEDNRKMDTFYKMEGILTLGILHIIPLG
jgi:hypothetical protein